jgi:hypothetical protein
MFFMNNDELLTYLNEQKINDLYPYLSLPSEWLPDLIDLGLTIRNSLELQDYYLKTCRFFLDEEKPDFSEWIPPKVQEKPRDDFFLFLSLLAVDKIIEHHSSLSIPMEITKETCSGVGTKSKDFFFFNKRPGTNQRAIYWFRHPMEGRLYKVGRFEFMLKKASDIEKVLKDHIGDDGWVLDMHIPGGGAMSLNASYDSWKRGIEFFDRYFPDKKVKAVICISWIFSPDLKEFLPAESNLIKLLNEVEIFPVNWSEMEGFSFIMGTASKDIDSWPENTSLQRAYKKHIQSGGKVRTGAMYIKRNKIFNYQAT